MYLHWDGKLLPEFTGSENVVRFPVSKLLLWKVELDENGH